MPRDTWCKHYRAMSSHETCKAGVEYATFQGQPFDARPCFHKCGGCELAIYRTEEEIAAEEAWFEERLEKTGKAREAIVTHLGGPWKRGAPGASGCIDCPACGGNQTLAFSRAGYNGHIHACCSTEGCVSWME